MPKLTRFDKRVLRFVPAWWDEETNKLACSIDVWRLGYEMRHLDVPELVQTLRGLERMGLVGHTYCGSYRSGYDVWWRTKAGDEALATALEETER